MCLTKAADQKTCAAPVVTLELPSESVSPRRLLLHCEDVISEKTHDERTTPRFHVAVQQLWQCPGVLVSSVFTVGRRHIVCCSLMSCMSHTGCLFHCLYSRLIPLPVSLYYAVSRLISIT